MSFPTNTKVLFLIVLIVILFSGIVIAQQIQVVPLDKMKIGSFLERIKIPEKERLIVEGNDEQVYTSKGCKIIHKLEDGFSIECPANVVYQIPNAIRDAKLQTQNVSLSEDELRTLDIPNNEYLHVTQVWQQGYTGKDRIIAILDTGIDYKHPALSDSIIAKKSFVTYTNDSMDDVGHGTHVSGIVTGNGNPNDMKCLRYDGWYYKSVDCSRSHDIEVQKPEDVSKGVAPDAKLMMAKVCGVDGCSVGDIVAGLEWVVAGYNRTGDCFDECEYDSSCCRSHDGCSYVKTNSRTNKYNCTGTYIENIKPDAISISLGSSSTWLNSNCDNNKQTSWEAYLAKKIDWAVKKGIVVVVAAGNWPYGVSSPACASKAIAVGGVDWFNYENQTYDVVWSMSGKGYSMKDHGVLAPWIAISTLPDNSYGILGGTSMAAPHVAGLVALMKEKNPKLTVDQIEYRIFKRSVELDAEQQICFLSECFQVPVFQADNHPYEEGNGKIDATRILDAVQK